MKLSKSPCTEQGCTNYNINTNCYTRCAAWQTWFRESWRELQKRLGAKPKEKEGKA